MLSPKDIDLKNTFPSQASDINMPDWEITPAPQSRGSFLPSFRDAYNIQAPAATGSNKPFPDYVTVEPNTVTDFLHSLSTSPDVGLGLVKKFVPGVSWVGDVLGRIGKTIEDTPFGQALEGPKNFITSGAEGIVGSTIESLGNAKNALLNPEGLTPFAPAAQVGRQLLDWTGNNNSGLDQALTYQKPKDVGDALGQGLSTLSLIPAFKGASLALRGAAAIPLAGDFVSGVTSALSRKAVNDVVAFKAGQLAGRALLATEGAGLAAEFTLPKVAPDADWSREIMTNRVVAEDSPWRFPWEAATSLALDLPGLAKLATDNRLAAQIARKSLGPVPLPSQIRLGNEAINNALNAGIVSNADLNLLDDYAIRQTAENYVVRAWSESLGIEAKTAHDLPMTQAELNQSIRQMTDQLYKELGPAELHRQAADTMLSDFNKHIGDWNALDTAGKLQQFKNYAAIVRTFEAQVPGMSIGVASDAAFAKIQAPDAFAYLKDALDKGTWNKATQANFAAHYPSLANPDTIGAALDDPERLVAELRGIAGGGSETELKDLQSQIANIENKLAQGVPVQDQPALYKTLTDLEGRQALLLEPPVGAMQASLDRLLTKIVSDGQTNLGDEAKALLGKINSAKAGQAADIEKQIQVVESAMGARESEIALSNGQAIDSAAIDAEWDALNAQRSRLIQDYAETSLAGSRWTLTYSPAGPVMRLTDELGKDFFASKGLARGERTPVGQIFDKLFGAIPDKKLGIAANKYVTDNVGAANGRLKTDEFMQALKTEASRLSVELPSGHTWSMFSSVWHLTPMQINNIAKEIGMATPAGFKSMAEVIYRAYPGPLKIFAKQALGKELPDMPWLHGYGQAVRSLYPAFRFSFSPRFLAMNYFESPLIGIAQGGAKFLKGNPPESLLKLARAGAAETGLAHGGTFKIGEQQSRNLARALYSKRPDEIVEGFLDTIAAQPEMKGVLETLGSRENWVKAIDDMQAQRLDILAAKNAKTDQEKALADKIADLGKSVRIGSSGDQLIARKELAKAQDQYIRLTTDRTIEDAWKATGAKIDQYQPFMVAMKHSEEMLLKDLRATFYGNPQRGAVERLANSFLLYWPISYQIKASKILADFVLNKPFGIKANAFGAIAYGKVHRDIENEIQTNPYGETAQFFSKNKELLFTLRQFFPITPDDLGVSLSPVVRVPLQLARGQLSPSQAAGRFDQGPAYDFTLFQRIVAEQSKPGGIFHRVFNGDNNGQ